MIRKGKYIIENKNKYTYDLNNVVFRSGLERKFFIYCDRNKNVTRWESESIPIPYLSPLDGKVHKYFPDVYMEITGNTGKVKKILVEIKPSSQTVPPKKGKNYRERLATWLVNCAKWEAAKRWTEKNGIEFMILTEKDIQ